jgi:small subunit ribosomal protein S8
VDTIGDFLTRIRNAQAAKHEKVDVPASNLRQGLAQVLQEQNYISHFKVVKDNKQGMMRVYLKYSDEGKPSITRLKRYSRPSRRQYVKAADIPNIRAGYGMAVLSTSKGIMSGGKAKDQNVGGELLCVVW